MRFNIIRSMIVNCQSISRIKDKIDTISFNLSFKRWKIYSGYKCIKFCIEAILSQEKKKKKKTESSSSQIYWKKQINYCIEQIEQNVYKSIILKFNIKKVNNNKINNNKEIKNKFIMEVKKIFSLCFGWDVKFKI